MYSLLQSCKLYKLFLLPATISLTAYNHTIDKGKQSIQQIVEYLRPAAQRVPMEEPCYWLTPDIPIFPREVKVAAATTSVSIITSAFIYIFYKLTVWMSTKKTQTNRIMRV